MRRGSRCTFSPYLAGVPGFYKTDSGEWSFINEKRGILIPVREEHGSIQGLQIRRDNVTRRKFRWVSSVGKNDGCGAEAWAHLAGPPRQTILLTEGPMKADVIHNLTGQTVVAVPGVSSLTHLERMLTYLREMGTTKIMTAFDMDFLSNPNVQNGYNMFRAGGALPRWMNLMLPPPFQVLQEAPVLPLHPPERCRGYGGSRQWW